jgi:hypothetical protein
MNWFDQFPESQFPSVSNHDLYVHNIITGLERMSTSDVTVMGITRNSEKILPYTLSRMERMCSMFKWANMTVYTNDNEDNTLKVLEEYKGNYILNTIEENVGRSKHDSVRNFSRTVDMAYYRNNYLKDFRTDLNIEETDYIKDMYVIILDMDVEGGFSYEGLANTFGYNNWDVMASNSYLYRDTEQGPQRLHYDSWAFREFGHEEPHEDEHVNLMEFNRGDRPLEVFSAFGGLAVYKAKTLLDGNPEYLEGDCDHCTLHKQIRENGYKIFMNPSQISLYNKTRYTT